MTWEVVLVKSTEAQDCFGFSPLVSASPHHKDWMK